MLDRTVRLIPWMLIADQYVLINYFRQSSWKSRHSMFLGLSLIKQTDGRSLSKSEAFRLSPKELSLKKEMAQGRILICTVCQEVCLNTVELEACRHAYCRGCIALYVQSQTERPLKCLGFKCTAFLSHKILKELEFELSVDNMECATSEEKAKPAGTKTEKQTKSSLVSNIAYIELNSNPNCEIHLPTVAQSNPKNAIPEQDMTAVTSIWPYPCKTCSLFEPDVFISNNQKTIYKEKARCASCINYNLKNPIINLKRPIDSKNSPTIKKAPRILESLPKLNIFNESYNHSDNFISPNYAHQDNSNHTHHISLNNLQKETRLNPATDIHRALDHIQNGSGVGNFTDQRNFGSLSERGDDFIEFSKDKSNRDHALLSVSKFNDLSDEEGVIGKVVLAPYIPSIQNDKDNSSSSSGSFRNINIGIEQRWRDRVIKYAY